MPIHLPTDPTASSDDVVVPAAAPSPSGGHEMGGIRELISLMRELIDRLEDRIDQLQRPADKK